MRRNRLAVAVIGEGITEVYYIQSLRDVLRIKPAAVKPKNSSLKELEIAIKGCIRKGYDKIYCLIDMDNKIQDGNPDHERNSRDYSVLKRRYHNKQHRNSEGSSSLVLMVESYPATEVFFLYYFGYSSALHTNQGLKALLNRKIGYITEEKYLSSYSLHERLIEHGGALETAVTASEKSMEDNMLGENGRCYTAIGAMIRDLCPLD